MSLDMPEVCCDVLRIIPLDEYTTLFMLLAIKSWLVVSSLWDKLMNNAAINIHIQDLVGNFLGLEA